jgi:hypothetical protein
MIFIFNTFKSVTLYCFSIWCELVHKLEYDKEQI